MDNIIIANSAVGGAKITNDPNLDLDVNISNTFDGIILDIFCDYSAFLELN